MSFECGQQRVMRLGRERLRSLALRRVLTNRMREYFTYGSVGGAGGNPGSYPAPNRHLRLGICLGVFGFHKSCRGGRYWSLGDITRMRRFGLATLFGIALLNFFLAYSGHYLSSQVRQFIADHHTKPSSFSLIALAIPPWFYFIAAVAAVAAILGLTRRLGDSGVVYTVVGLLLLDIIALLVSLWGVGVFLFPFYERVA